MPYLTTSPRFAGAAGPWSPLNLAGLKSWHDSSDAASFTYSSGVLVSQWNDLSGNANHMTSPASKEPSRTGTQNSLAIVEFAPGAGNVDNGDYLDLPNVFSALSQVTVYMVIKTRSDPNADEFNTAGPMYFNTHANANHYPYVDGNVYMGLGSTARKDAAGNPSTALNTWHTLAISSASADWNMRINGTSQYSTGTNTVGINTNPRLGVGSSGVGWKFDGWLAELAIAEAGYDASFQTYAQAKWATP